MHLCCKIKKGGDYLFKYNKDKPLRIGEIDWNAKLEQADVFLCKPDKTTISKITEAYDITYTTKISIVNQLSFKIPTKIEKDRAFIHNPHIEGIRPRYIIKFIYNEHTEYFVVTEQSKNGSSNGKYIEYSVQGLGYELIDKHHKRIELESAYLNEIANEVLRDTLWKVSYVEPDFVARYKKRSYEFTSQTALQIIYDLAKQFNAILHWDTKTREIKFLKAERAGRNRGFKIRNGKYLDTIDFRIDSDEIVTHLKAYGHNNLTFAEINPTGLPSIGSYRWFLYPYEEDSTGNVIKSSYYFSDDASKAILAYERLVNQHVDDFELYLKQLDVITDEVHKAEREVQKVESDLKAILDKIDLSNASIQIKEDLNVEEYDDNHWKLVDEKYRLMALLDSREESLASVETERDKTEKKINELKKLLSVENNFTKSQQEQLIQFKIEKEYTDSTIEDPVDLMEDAKKAFQKLGKPKITARVSIVNLLEVLEAQHDWDKLRLGDDIYIEETDLEISIEAKITEIIYSFENKEISIVIENEIDKGDIVKDLISDGAAGNAIINHDKWDWGLSKENNGMINDIINNKWDAEKQAIEAGYKQLIEISERGIIVTSPDEECKRVVIQAGRIALTMDCGDTWKTVINPDGIWAEYLWGKVISGVNLIIEDESGIWVTQGSRTTVYDRNRKEVMRLGLVTDDEEKECFGIKSWNDVNMIEMTDCLGFAISKWDLEKDDWDKVFWAMPDGTIASKNMVAEGIKIVNSIGDYIIDAEKDFMDLGALETIVADNVISPMEKLDLAHTLLDFHERFRSAYIRAQKYYYSNRDIIYDVDGAYDTSKKSFDIVTEPQDNKDKKYLGSMYNVTKHYQTLLEAMEKYIKITIPRLRPDPSIHNVIDLLPEPTVATDFIPSTLTVHYHDKLMNTTSELEDGERKELLNKADKYLIALRHFEKEMTDMIFYSGLQLGNYYNNVIIDEHGFIAVRSDGMYRAFLNATHGLALQRWEDGKWVSKLYGTLNHPDWDDGTLYAEGMVTKNLKIVDADLGEKITFDHEDGITIYGNNGEIIKLNANEAISIYTNGDKKFWVGTDGRLYAKDMTTHNLKIVDGQLGEKIIFDHEDGITINGNNKEQIRLNANEGIAVDVDGEQRIWIGKDGLMYAKKLYIMGEDSDEILKDVDGSYISDLTVNRLKTLNSNNPQNIVHIEDNYIKLKSRVSKTTEYEKFTLSFNGTGQDAYPVMRWGAGSIGDSDSNVATQYKTQSGFFSKYVATDSSYFSEVNLKGVGIEANTSGNFTSKSKYTIFEAENQIMLKVGGNRVEINNQGVTINGQRINLN